MAENNLARTRNDVPDIFADGDPLAELARIVGYDERLVPTAQAPVPAGLSAPRREPVFNLEDELLREFERYDTPRLDPANDLAPVPLPMEAELAPAEPLAADVAPAVTLEQPDPFADRDWHGNVMPAAASEFVAEPAAPAIEPEFSETGFNEPAYSEPSFEAQPVAVETPATAEPYAFDLADELESSIAVAPAVVADTPPDAEPKRKSGAYTPGFRMPLANFNTNSRAGGLAAAAPEPAPVLEPEPVRQETPAVSDLTAWEFSAPAPKGASEPWSSAAASSQVEAEVVPAVGSGTFHPLNELVYDVDPYAAVSKAAPQAVESVEPQAVETVEPQAVETFATAQVAPVTAVQAEPVNADPVADVDLDLPADFAFDPFTDDEFELALDDLELDLADVVVAENSRFAAEPVVTPAPVQVQPVAPAMVQPVAAPMPAPAAMVAAAAPMAVAPVPVQPAPEAFDAAEPEQDLPFDPALISENEERPEAIADLDVPAFPAAEPEHEPAYRPDYDIDIDAELATLLVAATPAATPEPARAPAAPAAASEGKPQGQRSVYADLDEFERALEEDFRRSLATPLPPSEPYASANGYGDDANQPQSTRSSRNWVLPVAVVGVLALAGGSAYAWLSSGVSGLASGEPVIIAADKDPIKMAPENPGGKTVPNQDKAVYDRVAGAPPESPKQQTLISSNEEPMDVVQKTLMPDTLPLEGEDDVQPTDVGETEDLRLLPQQDQQAAAASQQDPVTITPRKVKTMIVRPDGKLVEQEVAAPAPTLAARNEKIPSAPARSVEVAALPAQQPLPAATAPNGTGAKPAGIVPVSAPVGLSEPAPMAPVSNPPAAAGTPAPRAPVPAMRPSQQPVNVVAAVTDQGNVRPAAPAAPAASAASPAPAASAGTQVASLGNGGYVIQIASLPSQPDAQKSYQNLSSKFGSVIGGRGVDIKAAEVAGKGTFYRVRIPAGSKADAVALCERYRSAGGTCLVAK
jgi:hypothetical protein